MILELLGQSEVNCSCLSHIDFNQYDQKGQECHLNIFTKDTGVLMDLFQYKHYIYYLFIVLGTNKGQL